MLQVMHDPVDRSAGLQVQRTGCERHIHEAAALLHAEAEHDLGLHGSIEFQEEEYVVRPVIAQAPLRTYLSRSYVSVHSDHFVDVRPVRGVQNDEGDVAAVGHLASDGRVVRNWDEVLRWDPDL